MWYSWGIYREDLMKFVVINGMYKLRVEIHFVLNTSFVRTYVNKKEFYVLGMRLHKTE